MSDNKNKIPFYVNLKNTRESKEIDLQTISDLTKINISYLESIEKGDLDIVAPTFLRLFIKSYAQFLKLDTDQILKEYEKEKNINKKNIFKNLEPSPSNDKISETRKLSNKEGNNRLSNTTPNNENTNPLTKDTTKLNYNAEKKNDELDSVIEQKENKLIFEDFKNTKNINFNIKDVYFLKPRKIFNVAVTFLSIILIYYLVTILNSTQKETRSNTNTKEIINSDNQMNTIQNQDMNEELLNSSNFDKKKFIDEFSKKLKFDINIPYTFKVVTNKKTKINISYDNDNNEQIEECNIIAKQDTLLKYKKNNNIYFDLWSATDVQIDIDNNSISKYLGKENLSVRGSFNPDSKLLYLKFYSR